jgi:hypothetical protein
VINIKLYYKLAAGAGAAILATALFAGSAMAADLEISGNGKDSTNTIVVTEESCCVVIQSSTTNVGAWVDASASTGGNKASGNTGGDTSISTGDATATASVTVTGGGNSANNPCCCTPDPCENEGCIQGSPSTLISENGADSENTIVVTKKKKTMVLQDTDTNVLAGVKAKAKTGRNRARNNTGGTTSITTGNATSDAYVDVAGGSNTIN